MDDSDEDLYGPSEGAVAAQADRSGSNVADATNTKQPDEKEEDVEEYEEVEDDEDDLDIIIEASPETIASVQARHAAIRGDTHRQPADTPPLSKQQQQQQRQPTPLTGAAQPHHANIPPAPRPDTHIPTPSSLKPTGPPKPGSAYPPIHASTLDVNANPLYAPANKPLLSLNLDADIPGDDKPWRKPGTDLSDYFNYGFDEFTWATYCLKQQETHRSLDDQKKMMEEMNAFLAMTAGGIPGMPPVVPPPPGAVGGPLTQQQQQQQQQQVQQQVHHQGMAQGPQGAGPGPGPGPAGMVPTPPPPPPPGMGPMPMMPGMPGMSEIPPEMMQAMMGGMMQQGMDPQQAMESMMGMQAGHPMMGGGGGPGGGGGGPGGGGPGGPGGPGQSGQMQGPLQGPFGGQPGQRMPGVGGQPQMGYNAFDQRGGFGPGMRGKGGRRW